MRHRGAGPRGSIVNPTAKPQTQRSRQRYCCFGMVSDKRAQTSDSEVSATLAFAIDCRSLAARARAGASTFEQPIAAHFPPSLSTDR